MTRVHKSEAQSIAEARSRTYADEHIASVTRQGDYRAAMPRTAGGMMYALRKAYSEEVPSKIHDGPDAIDAGGTPRWSAAFTRYLTGSPTAVDDGGLRLTPLRASLAGMARAANETTRGFARIVGRIVIGEMTLGDAAEAEGIPQAYARIVAEKALAAVWSDMENRLALPKSTAAA